MAGMELSGQAGAAGRETAPWGKTSVKGFSTAVITQVALTKLRTRMWESRISLLQSLFGVIIPFGLPTGLNSEKVAALIQRLNSDPQFVLAQNVGTTHDLLDICLKRATVQGAQHVFQHVVSQEGKPVTNQKSSGEILKLTVHFT